MMGISTTRKSIRLVFSALALMAVFARAVIPTGYMLSMEKASLGNLFPITVCHGDGTTSDTVFLDFQTGNLLSSDTPIPSPEKDDSGTSACTLLAMSGHGTEPDLVSVLIAPRTKEMLVSPKPAFVVPGQGLAAPPPPARGPPILI